MAQSPEERKEAVRVTVLKRRDKAKVERAAYYLLNKERMNENSRLYHQKVREAVATKKEAGVAIDKQAPRNRLKKVVSQPDNMATIKEIANTLELLTNKFRKMIADPIYRFPKPAMIRTDGVDLYEIIAVREWIQQHKEAIVCVTITGATRKKATITMDKKIMLITAWLQKTKRITKYCNAQRVAINSKNFWVRWA